MRKACHVRLTPCILQIWMLFLVLRAPPAWASTPCTDLGHLGATFSHRLNLGPLGLPNSVQWARTLLSEAGDVLFLVAPTQDGLVIHKEPLYSNSRRRWVTTRDAGPRIIELPGPMGTSRVAPIGAPRVSGIVRLVHHKGQPYAIAVGTEGYVSLINVDTGKYITTFPVSDYFGVKSVHLDAQKLLVGIDRGVCLFRPHLQQRFWADKHPLQMVGLGEVGLHHMAVVPYSSEKGLDDPFTAAAISKERDRIQIIQNYTSGEREGRERLFVNDGFKIGYPAATDSRLVPVDQFKIAAVDAFQFPHAMDVDSGRGRGHWLLIKYVYPASMPTMTFFRIVNVADWFFNFENKQVRATPEFLTNDYPHMALFTTPPKGQHTERLVLMIADADFKRGYIYAVSADSQELTPITPNDLGQLGTAYLPFHMSLD